MNDHRAALGLKTRTPSHLDGRAPRAMKSGAYCPYMERMVELAREAGSVLRALGGELIHTSPGEAVAIVDDCLFAVRLRHLTLPTVTAIGSAFETLRSRYERVNYFGMAQAGQDPQSSEARAEMARIVREHTTAIIAAAIVCEGDGFRATVARSVITAVHMASRAVHPLKVFDASEPALRWLGSKQPSGAAIDREKLGRAAEALRASAA